MASFYIIVGTVMGTALEVAQSIKVLLESKGHQVTLTDRYCKGDLAKQPESLIIICSSNTGMGDLPENIMPLFEELKGAPPNIVGRKFTVINLGDSSYPTFGEAGHHLHEAFIDIGASPIEEVFTIDACETSEPETVAKSWLIDTLLNNHEF